MLNAPDVTWNLGKQEVHSMHMKINYLYGFDSKNFSLAGLKFINLFQALFLFQVNLYVWLKVINLRLF